VRLSVVLLRGHAPAFRASLSKCQPQARLLSALLDDGGLLGPVMSGWARELMSLFYLLVRRSQPAVVFLTKEIGALAAVLRVTTEPLTLSLGAQNGRGSSWAAVAMQISANGPRGEGGSACLCSGPDCPAAAPEMWPVVLP
jgi:hypothetical protein